MAAPDVTSAPEERSSDRIRDHIGLGCATFVTKSRGVPEREAVAILDAAYDAGVRFFDTARMYAGGRSEELLGEVLADRRDTITILTKGGVEMSDPNDVATMRFDASRSALRRHLEESLVRLRTDHVDVFVIHQLDTSRPIEEQMETLAGLRDEGLARAVGFSNFPIDACRAALATGVPNVVEYSYSLVDGRNVPMLDSTAAAGLHRIAFGVFAHGLLAEDLAEDTEFAVGDWRRRSRTTGDARNSGNALFAGSAYMANLAVARSLRRIAAGRGLALGPFVLAMSVAFGRADRYLIGCRSTAELRENLAALETAPTQAERDAVAATLGARSPGALDDEAEH
jgi:aryl-alcohol dehydrogenase-like predicted oxidoreductase